MPARDAALVDLFVLGLGQSEYYARLQQYAAFALGKAVFSVARNLACQLVGPFPSAELGKMDAETCALLPALTHSNVRMQSGAEVTRFLTRPDGHSIGWNMSRAASARQAVGALRMLPLHTDVAALRTTVGG